MKIKNSIKYSIVSAIVVLCVIGVYIHKSNAALLHQNYRKSSVGFYWLVTADVEINPTADEWDSGCDYVFAHSLEPRTATDVVSVANSNDGTPGSSDGDIYISILATSGGEDTSTGSMLAICK